MGAAVKGVPVSAQCQSNAVKWEGGHCHVVRSPSFPRKANTFDFHVKSHEVQYFIDIVHTKTSTALVGPSGYDVCFTS